MEKGREMVKRGNTKRQPKQSGNGDMRILEKSKKDKARCSRLNSRREGSEMGGGSEGEVEEEEVEEELKNSSKRSKLQNKPLKISNVVTQVSVPRKLRSAMNKRSRESLSPPLHFSFNGMELSQLSGGKKSMKEGRDRDQPPQQANAIPITKEEEEVVETLFSLARMLPNNKSKAEENTSEEGPSSLKDDGNTTVLALEAPKEKSVLSDQACPGPEATNLSSSFEGSAKEDKTVICLPDLAVLTPYTVPGNHKLDISLDSTTTRAELARISKPPMSVHADNIPLTDAMKSISSFELSQANGSIQVANHEGSLLEKKQETAQWQVATILSREGQHSMKEEKGKSTLPAFMQDPSLWPYISTVPLSGAEIHGSSSSKPFSMKIPAWLASATSATQHGSTASSTTEKVHHVMAEKKSWKKGLTHVYISHLIQSYQTVESKPSWPVLPSQLKPNQGTKFGFATTNDLTESRSGLNSVIPAGKVNVSNGYTAVPDPSSFVSGKDPNEVQILDVKGKMLEQDHTSSTACQTYLSDKQNCSFLSLSTGSNGGLVPVPPPPTNNSQRGAVMESSAQVNIPYLHPNFQHHPLMPFPFPQVQYPASSQLQVPQYAGSHLYGSPHPSRAGSQGQNQMWAAQLAAAQYRPGGGMPGSQFPKWHNGRYEPPSIINPSSQPSHHPSSSSPLEMLGFKYSSGLQQQQQQQQQLFALSSPSTSRGSQQHHPVHSSFSVGGVGGFRSGDAPQLQLVCNSDN